MQVPKISGSVHSDAFSTILVSLESWPIPANSSSSKSCYYLLKFTISLAFTQIINLVRGGWRSCQGLTTTKNVDEKKRQMSKYTMKTSDLEKDQKSQNVVLKILKYKHGPRKIFLYIKNYF